MAHVIWTGTGASVRSAISANVAVASTTSDVGSGPPIDATHCTLRLLSRLVTVSVALNGTPAALAWHRSVASMSLLNVATPLTASGSRGTAIWAGVVVVGHGAAGEVADGRRAERRRCPSGRAVTDGGGGLGERRRGSDSADHGADRAGGGGLVVAAAAVEQERRRCRRSR